MDTITKSGLWKTPTTDCNYLVNNPTATNTTTGWTFGGTTTINNGIVTLTGTNPGIKSDNFTVNPDDIIVFELSIALPTGGVGICLGATQGVGVYVHTFSLTNGTWVKSTSTNTNSYFFAGYRLAQTLTQKHYILGYNVDLANVPAGTTTNTSYPPKAIQLPSGTTTIRIRSEYNGSNSLVINFTNPSIYKLNEVGLSEVNDIAAIGKNYIQGTSFIEI